MVFLFLVFKYYFYYYCLYLISYILNISSYISSNNYVHANCLPLIVNYSLFFYINNSSSSNPLNTLILLLSSYLFPLSFYLFIIWTEFPNIELPIIITLSLSVFYNYSITLTCYYIHDYCYYICLFNYDIWVYFD